jgi:hypothetical protein
VGNYPFSSQNVEGPSMGLGHVPPAVQTILLEVTMNDGLD